jgi:hypothetical protein
MAFPDKHAMEVVVRSFRMPALMGALVVCVSLATAFSAATAQAATGSPAAAGRAASTSPAEVVTEGTPVATSVPAANDSAGDPCTTDTYTRYLIDELTQQHVAWFRMQTYWCWNGRKVKSHTTSESGAVTQLGSLEGWVYNGHDATVFNCYVASGSTVNCSGNHEQDQGFFQECILKVGCVGTWDPTIEMWENYKGQWFYGS